MSQELASYTISVTTNTTGASTDTADDAVFGLLHAVELVAGTMTATTTAQYVLSVTGTESAVDHTLLTLQLTTVSNAWYFPRTLEDDNTGTALSTYTYDIINGRLKLATTSAGASKTGSLRVYYVPIG